MATYVTECSNVNSKCAGYDSSIHKDASTAYKCSGNRSINTNKQFFTFTPSSSDYPEYEAGTIIEAIDISSIYSTLANEVNERLSHLIYAGAKPVTGEVNPGNVIDDVQQTSLKTMIENMSKLINSNASFGDTSLGIKPTSLTSVSEGDIVATGDIKPLAKAISKVGNGVNAMVQDCICYSDCTNYYTYLRKVCSCVTNFGCCYD